MLQIVSGLMLLIVTISSLAFNDNEARLLHQSTSGQTALFSIGSLDGLKEGDYGVIVKQIRDLRLKDLRFVPVAKAKNIKLSTDSSIWILYHVYDNELLIKGDKFIVLTESNMLRGRAEARFNRIALVNKKGESSQRAMDVMRDDRDRLAKKKNHYQKIAETKEIIPQSDVDFELIDLEGWEKIKGDRYRVALYKSPHRSEFRRNYRINTFQNLVAAYLKRVNDPEFNYESFYDEQMRLEFSNEFRQKSSLDSEYYAFLRNQVNVSKENAKLYRSLLEKGETWSEDFSDEELRHTLSNVSILQEADRKIKVMSKPFRYTVAVDYGKHFIDPQTEHDASYRRENRYAFSTELEATPLLGHETFERFTVAGELRRNKNAFSAENYNAAFNETSTALGINWYPVYSPYTLESFMIFVGTYVRMGQATGTIMATGQQSNFNVYSLPGFRVGMRYNLMNRIGLRMIASMETLKLEQTESNKLISEFPENINVVEGKIGIGLTYSF